MTNVVGVLGYDFDLYRIQPTEPADYESVNPRIDAPEDVNGSLKVAAMNTLNFFITPDYSSGNPLDNKCGPLQNVECRGHDANQPDEFTRQRDKLLAALAGLDADIIGLNELENTTGVDPLGDPVNGIVAGLNDLLGAGTYAYIDTGVIGTDAIRVGLIYKPAKVTPVGDFKIMDSSVDPRFVDTRNRPSLAQTFEEAATGARFTVVVNHLKSKGDSGLAFEGNETNPPGICVDDDPDNDIPDCDQGDGQGYWNYTRTQAAEALVDWLATDPTGSGDADVIIMGDLNSYAMENPIDAILSGGFTNLVKEYQGKYAYSYVFDGQFGYLDHSLSNASLTPQVTGAADWHINADEPDLLDYDTSFKPNEQDAIYEPNAYRSSDHDPVIVGLDLLHYDFSGFFPPIDDIPVLNAVKAGSAIPVKFSLGGDQGLDIFLAGYPLSRKIACDTNSPLDDIEQTVTAGGSSLSYDALSDQYTYVWKTNKAWAGTCRQLVVILKDGSIHLANFKFK
ncbi:MAG: ExeM/NucH family extracellular endonuclease [Chloroflexi bacterium]|nr:ExeM/NucH family extracellular endonuclease [Chloroflexota bacterium]